MRIGRITGNVVMDRKSKELEKGRYLVCEPLDDYALRRLDEEAHREKPLNQSLVVYDCLGAGVGSIIAYSESGEAAAPFYPKRVPIDGYCAAILDHINYS